MARNSKWKKYPKDAPLTIERLEQAMDMLSVLILEYGKRGHELLPMYRRLESELEAMKADDETMRKIKERAANH